MEGLLDRATTVPLAGLVVVLVLQAVVALDYNTTAKPVPEKLNVHFVAHSHDDLGWLKTVDQYYVGLRSDIQQASVEDIITTVIQELEENPDRKYIQVETGFFARWWKAQTGDKKASVKSLVTSGQLEFVNGGWCMHDEATTHYVDMIDQTTYGHRFLLRQLGVVPRHGWQIDPFGHSAVQGYLLGAEVGFESLFTARIDYQERAKRRAEKSLEMVWRGSETLGSSAEILFGVFPRHYNPPTSFEFEPWSPDYTPVQDDPDFGEYNVEDRVEDLIQAAQEQALLTRTNHIMWTMGDDFTYQNARTWFTNMDKLVHYVNLDGRINVLYSNPSIYVDAKQAANETWPLKTGDFFPYADSPLSYWTGYFTSRPALKGYVRRLSGYLQAARQLEFFVGRSSNGSTSNALEEAMATVQHHDGVSGTEKQAVADDYTKMLFEGASEAESVANSALSHLSDLAGSGCGNTTVKFEQCGNLNITYCPASEGPLNDTRLVVVAYNSLAWERDEYIRVLVGNDKVTVMDSEGKHVESQIVPVSDVSKRIRNFYVQVELDVEPPNGPLYWIVFKASVPPLGFASFVIEQSKSGIAQLSSIEVLNFSKNADALKIGGLNGTLELYFSSDTGQLFQMVGVNNKINLPVSQANLYYTGDLGEDGQASGAYIFRPADDVARNLSSFTEINTTVFRGQLVEEVHQVVSPWVNQVFRLFKGEDHAEVEFTIGPIPDDGVGKELISRFSTGLASKKTFYTDSNGRDFIKRTRNHRDDWPLQVAQPVAGNYYPINLGLYIADKDKNVEFSLLVDRAVGGSSIHDGEVEIMLHRSLMSDDARGVGEALKETVCLSDDHCEGLTVQGRYYVSLKSKDDAAVWRRSYGQRILAPFYLAFSKQCGTIPSFSAVAPNYNLPPNVALITLQELGNGLVLLRLAHLYQANEHADFSKMAYVNLKDLFNRRKIVEATELNLSANQARSMVRKRHWRVDGESACKQALRGKVFDAEKLTVELGPMEIRTFNLKFH